MVPAMTKPLVNTAQGQVIGKISVNHHGQPFYSFQGIPYAKPPVAHLRFADPAAPDPWKGVLDGTREGPECPSTSMFIPYYVGQEDNCLNLNVYSKTINSPMDENSKQLKQPLPVMVWIHGGGFVVGSNKTDLYGPEFLLTEDIVLVTINYRLGPLGFLCLEDSSLGVPGNAGLKDQVMALKWVQRNISHFGGDPNNVTIFGESAGAASVHYLVLSPLAKGLFHKAVMQSGVALNPWARGVRGANELCRRLGYHEKDEKKILEHLRNLSPSDLVKARLKSRDRLCAGERRYYGPVIEQHSPTAFISDTPENIIKSGNYNKVPMIMGCTNKEGLLFDLIRKVLPHVDYPIKDFIREVDFALHVPKEEEARAELANRVRAFYFGEEAQDTDNMESTVQLKTDTAFLHGVMRGARMHLAQCPEQPIYLYEMNVDTQRNMCKRMYTTDWLKVYAGLLFLVMRLPSSVASALKAIMLRLPCSQYEGAAHGDDLMYLFNTTMCYPLQPNTIEERAVFKFVKLWSNFARCGNPTPYLDPTLDNIIWPAMDQHLTYMDIGKELRIGQELHINRLTFWDRIYREFQP